MADGTTALILDLKYFSYLMPGSAQCKLLQNKVLILLIKHFLTTHSCVKEYRSLKERRKILLDACGFEHCSKESV